MDKSQLYNLVTLPDDTWRQHGKALHVPPKVRRYLLRFGMYRFLYGAQDGTIGLMMVEGPPGTGKSVMVRWAADAVIRALNTTGNALVINASRLMDEHLGRSQKNVDEFFDTVVFSADKKLTVIINRDYQDLSVSHVSGTFPSGTTL